MKSSKPKTIFDLYDMGSESDPGREPLERKPQERKQQQTTPRERKRKWLETMSDITNDWPFDGVLNDQHKE